MPFCLCTEGGECLPCSGGRKLGPHKEDPALCPYRCDGCTKRGPFPNKQTNKQIEKKSKFETLCSIYPPVKILQLKRKRFNCNGNKWQSRFVFEYFFNWNGNKWQSRFTFSTVSIATETNDSLDVFFCTVSVATKIYRFLAFLFLNYNQLVNSIDSIDTN